MPSVSPTACSDIFRYCDENVEERGKPVAVLPATTLPLTPMGKIDYRALEKEYGTYQYTKWDPLGDHA